MMSLVLFIATIAAAAATETATTAPKSYTSYDLEASSVSGKTDTLEESICPTMFSNTSVSPTDVFPTMVGYPTKSVTSVTMTDVPEASDQRPRFSAERRPIFSRDYLWILVEKAGPKFWGFLASGLVCFKLFISFVYPTPSIFEELKRVKCELRFARQLSYGMNKRGQDVTEIKKRCGRLVEKRNTLLQTIFENNGMGKAALSRLLKMDAKSLETLFFKFNALNWEYGSDVLESDEQKFQIASYVVLTLTVKKFIQLLPTTLHSDGKSVQSIVQDWFVEKGVGDSDNVTTVFQTVSKFCDSELDREKGFNSRVNLATGRSYTKSLTAGFFEMLTKFPDNPESVISLTVMDLLHSLSIVSAMTEEENVEITRRAKGPKGRMDYRAFTSLFGNPTTSSVSIFCEGSAQAIHWCKQHSDNYTYRLFGSPTDHKKGTCIMFSHSNDLTVDESATTGINEVISVLSQGSSRQYCLVVQNKEGQRIVLYGVHFKSGQEKTRDRDVERDVMEKAFVHITKTYPHSMVVTYGDLNSVGEEYELCRQLFTKLGGEESVIMAADKNGIQSSKWRSFYTTQTSKQFVEDNVVKSGGCATGADIIDNVRMSTIDCSVLDHETGSFNVYKGKFVLYVVVANLMGPKPYK